MNHLGKLMFQWFYWHGLLPGRDIPGIGSHMPAYGKHEAAQHGATEHPATEHDKEHVS